MKFAVLVSGFLLSAVALAHGPSPLLADDGRDLSFLLKRYDGPIPILRTTVKGKRHAVPRTLQVEEVPVRRALNGLVERQQCTNPNYLPCSSGLQCCPAGTICGTGSCCLAGQLPCAGGGCCSDALGDCCVDETCCPADYVCAPANNGAIGCCRRGQTCSGNLSGVCADKTGVPCPGETTCCPAGTTCGARDTTGKVTCLDSRGVTITITNTVTNVNTNTGNNNGRNSNTIANINTNTGDNNGRNSSTINGATTTGTTTPSSSGWNNNNPLDHIKKNAALPQVVVILGLMVTVAFLSAFLF